MVHSISAEKSSVAVGLSFSFTEFAIFLIEPDHLWCSQEASKLDLASDTVLYTLTRRKLQISIQLSTGLVLLDFSSVPWILRNSIRAFIHP